MTVDTLAHTLMIRQSTSTIIDMASTMTGDHEERLVVLRDAMTRLDEERDRLRAEQKRAVAAAVEAGLTNESQLARLAGVTRLTIRAWLGKSV